MVAKRKHGLSKKLRLAFLPLLANRSVNTESIRSVANSVGQGVSSLSTSQIRLDLEKGEKILFDDDVAREINLPLQDGSHFTWPIASPQGLLRKYSAASPALRRMLSKSPNTADRPWGLVHYHDEISPGDILRPILSRQHTVFRFTFKEFGKTMLSNTRLWFTYAVLRTTVSSRVVGGLSRCFKELMRVFFPDARKFPRGRCSNRHRCGQDPFFRGEPQRGGGRESLEDDIQLQGSERVEAMRRLCKCIHERLLEK